MYTCGASGKDADDLSVTPKNDALEFLSIPGEDMCLPGLREKTQVMREDECLH